MIFNPVETTNINIIKNRISITHPIEKLLMWLSLIN